MVRWRSASQLLRRAQCSASRSCRSRASFHPPPARVASAGSAAPHCALRIVSQVRRILLPRRPPLRFVGLRPLRSLRCARLTAAQGGSPHPQTTGVGKKEATTKTSNSNDKKRSTKTEVQPASRLRRAHRSHTSVHVSGSLAALSHGPACAGRGTLGTRRVPCGAPTAHSRAATKAKAKTDFDNLLVLFRQYSWSSLSTRFAPRPPGTPSHTKAATP